MVDPQGGIAQLGEEVIGVRREDEDARLLHHLLELDAGLGHKRGIDSTNALVEQEDFRLDGGDDAEGEAHAHAVGVGAQRHRQIIAEFGELRDLIHLGLHLLDGLAQEETADDDVVVAGDLRVHAHAQVEDRRDAPAHVRGAAGGLIDAGEQAQQRGLAGAVMAHKPHAVALTQVQVDVLESLDHDGIGSVLTNRTAGGGEHGLL